VEGPAVSLGSRLFVSYSRVDEPITVLSAAVLPPKGTSITHPRTNGFKGGLGRKVFFRVSREN